jgi:hypothetical protein
MRNVTKTFKVSHKRFGKMDIQADFPQAETFEESVGWTGGEAKVVETLNWAAEFRAKSGIRSRAASSSETETRDELLNAFVEIASGAMPSAGRSGPTKNDKVEFAEKLQALKAGGAEVSGDALLDLARQYGIL